MMKEEEAAAKIAAGLSRIYGIGEGLRMAGTVVPGIMKDFKQMLLLEKEGAVISEEYRLEDGRARVLLAGTCSREGALFTKAEVI